MIYLKICLQIDPFLDEAASINLGPSHQLPVENTH